MLLPIILSCIIIFHSISSQAVPPNGTDVCSVCDCYNTTIDCTNKKLQTSFSVHDTWPSSNYTTLLMNINVIGHILPFPALPLQSISFRYNRLVKIEDDAFMMLTELNELDLSHNQLISSGISENTFFGHFSVYDYKPIDIRNLNMSFNELTYLPSLSLQHTPYLEKLDLSYNPLGDDKGKLNVSTVIALASLGHLEFLDLTSTKISQLPETFLSNLRSLKELILSNNEFQYLPSESLSYASKLQILKLNNNPIKIISTSNKLPPSLATLKQIHISDMALLSRIEEESFAVATNLTYFDCKLNPNLEHISPKALNSSSLYRIDLNDNALSYIPEGLSSNWSRVIHVDIRGNPLSCDCENQWIIEKLIHRQALRTDGLFCKSPKSMEGLSFVTLGERHYHMRCLDYYGNHPEKDSTFLIATFVIVVLALVFMAVIWKCKGGRCRKGQNFDYTAIYHHQGVREEDKY